MSQWITHSGGYIGPFGVVQTLADRYLCDGTHEVLFSLLSSRAVTDVEPAAAANVRQAVVAELARVAAIEDNAKNDAVFAQFDGMTNQQIDDWFTANVTTLAQARAVLVRMAKRFLRLERRLKRFLG